MAVRADNGTTRAEARMELSAIRRGWNVPADIKARCLERAAELLEEGPRLAKSGMEIINAFERTTIEAERLELDRLKFERGAEQAPTQIIINTAEPPQPEPLPEPGDS